MGFCVSCSEEDNYGYTGTAEAKKNGDSWTSHIKVEKSQPFDIGLSIQFTVLDQDDLTKEFMNIFRVQANLDYQQIHSTSSRIRSDSTGVNYATALGGDVLGDVYDWAATTEPGNFIQLTRIDLGKGEIEGIFDVSLKLTRDDNQGPVPPQIIKFTEGTFKSKVQKEWFD